METDRLKYPAFLFIVLITTVILQVSGAEVPSDADIRELEQQIKQQEAEQEKARQRAAEKARRKAEEQKLMDERARLEEERQQLEAERKRQDQERQQAEQERKEKEKYISFISAAETALDDRDRDTAIDNFEQALVIYPDDAAAKQGLAEAKSLKDKICYAFTGTWKLKEFVGGLLIKIKEDGTFIHGSDNSVVTTWSCLPEKRQITEGSFGWKYTLSEDGTCLQFEHRNNCFSRH